jgi:LDH2 family malate/lactate/ureidoglycolate dehydrogenase
VGYASSGAEDDLSSADPDSWEIPVTTETPAAHRYDAGALEAFAEEVLVRAGLSTEDARTVAPLIVRADLRGIETHGLVRLPMYADRIRSGGIDPGASMQFVRSSGATALLDAAGGMGHLAAHRAMERALELAASVGVGVVGVRGSGHFGATDAYAMYAPPRGMIGIVTTNAPPALAPTGGLTPLFGTNPWAMAVPAGREEPIVMDFALTAVARGRIRKALDLGQAIPTTWALDKDGHPTADPAAALEGLLQPIGGHKGYAMALAVDVLAGLLTGASSTSDLQPPQDAAARQDVGHLFIAIDVARFSTVDTFTSRVDGLVRQVRGSARAEGVERIYLPGEIEHEREMDATAHGVPLSAHVVRALAGTAEAYQVELPSPLDRAEGPRADEPAGPR